jgi:hypothetical protein
MKTIALRFGEHFSPECGTIAAHQEIIDRLGFVWYGKLGTPVNQKIIAEMLENDSPRFLLINSGKADRYWVHFSAISKETPPFDEFPEYYHELGDKMKTWFKVTSFEPAEKGIMAKCFVDSSGSPLTEASKHSMSPYFIINYEEGGE